MRKQEQDYPTRAEFAAVLNWWEICRGTLFLTRMRGVTPPEHYGPFKRWLARAAYAAKPDGTIGGTWLWLIPLGLGPATVVSYAFQSYFGMWAARPGVIVGLIPLILVTVLAQVMWFRAGGWELALEKRDQKSVGPRRQEEMS